jgi:hypothetical protein
MILVRFAAEVFQIAPRLHGVSATCVRSAFEQQVRLRQ